MKRILLSAVSVALVSLSAASFADVTTQYSLVTDLTGSERATGAASLERSKNAIGGISAGNGMGGGSINLEYGLKGGEGAGGPNQPCCFGELRKNNGRGAKIHLLVDEHHVFDDWISDLFFPDPPAEGNQRAVIFLALDNDDDSDSDSDSD